MAINPSSDGNPFVRLSYAQAAVPYEHAGPSVQRGPMPGPAAGEHPWWCVRRYCTATLTGVDGVHRSTPFKIDKPGLLTANLYADPTVPRVVMVEVRGIRILLPADEAYGLGHVLISLGKGARDGW